MERIIEAYFRETCIPLPFEQRQSAYWARRSISYFCYKAIKRLADIVFSLICCLFIAPLALIIKVAYLITGDTKSIFYQQQRIGRDGQIFNLYKFRTMIPGAEASLEKILAENPELAAEYLKNKKLKNDPRVTKIGKILRKTSLDEVPQFINILTGKMSLIGNRPYLPHESDDMGIYQRMLTRQKPGLISYWSVNGRNDVDFFERIKLECYYSRNANLLLDVRIFFASISVVLTGKGAL